MKRLLLSSLLLLTAAAAHADVTLNLGGGNLYTAGGTSLAPVGSLVQLVVSTGDNLFSAPTPNSFVGTSTDDFVLASFTIDDAAGAFTQPITFTLGVNSVTAGDLLMLRWYPTLTSASGPGEGTSYGEFRTDAVQSFSNIAWAVPNDGTYDLNFLTEAFGGPNAESAGYANFTVVPEPSSVALLAFGGIAGAVAVFRRRK